MENKEKFITRYKFDGLINNTVAMIKYTWKNSLIMSLCVFIPTSFIYTLGMVGLFKGLDLKNLDTNFSAMLPGYLAFMASLVPLALGSLFVNAVVASTAFDKARGISRPLGAIVKDVFYGLMGSLVAQSVIVGFVIIGFSIAAISGAALVAKAIDPSADSKAIAGYLMLCAPFIIYFFTWFSIAATFAPESVIFDRLRAHESIGKSFSLIRSNWWRVFGLLLLAEIIIMFGTSLAITPITFFPQLPSLMDFYKSILGQGSSESMENLREATAKFYKASLVPSAIGAALSMIFTSMVLPVFRCLIFIDLKVKKKELETPKPLSLLAAYRKRKAIKDERLQVNRAWSVVRSRFTRIANKSTPSAGNL
jgi:hypothetical protein